MGGVSSKESAYLARNHTFRITFSLRSVKGSEFTTKDVKLSSARETSDKEESSPLFDSLTNYFQKQKTSNGNSKLMGFWATQNEKETIFHLHFSKEFLNSLCGMLPKPFIQIKGDIDVPGMNSIAVDKSVELQELTSSGKNIWDLAFTKTVLTKNTYLELNGSFKCDIILGWSKPEKPGKSDLPPIKIKVATVSQNLFGRESSKDLTIVAGNGAEIKCHKIILEAHSTVLAMMVSSLNGTKESKAGRIEMRENSEVGINQLLRYLYGMELATSDLTCDIAVELFQTAHKYELPDLQNSLYELLLQVGTDYFTPPRGSDVLLKLYFYVKDLDEFTKLRDHARTIMMNLSKEIRSCDRFKALTREDALELVWTLFDLRNEK